ncbi:VanZ family protein [Pelagibacteraceae bacterium]|jgi:VanZ family protein|nr:VanZ family protein [Pelagibacteraceae bacterium]
MKNNIYKFIVYLYYLSLIVLIILYLFPGSIIGYFFYGNSNIQPNLIKNPIGTSINHFFYFSFLSFLGFIYNLNKQKFINSFFFLFILSLLLELLHLFIPNRAFELNDVLANITGVVVIYFLFFFKKLLNEKI